MAIHGSGIPIDMDEIAAEFGGNKPYSLSTYIRNGAYVPDAPQNANIPTTLNNISMDDFYGATKLISMTYEIIGGGGEGGGGYYGGTGASGTASSFSATGIATVTSSGGAGGAATGLFGSENGHASYYGAGGQGGLNSDSGNQTIGWSAPSSSYGAGGGGGGSAPFSAYNGGYGGRAAIRQAGTISIVPSTVVTVTIGSGGAAIYGGGNGAGGYAKFTVGGQTFTFTSSGSFTVP